MDARIGVGEGGVRLSSNNPEPMITSSDNRSFEIFCFLL